MALLRSTTRAAIARRPAGRYISGERKTLPWEASLTPRDHHGRRRLLHAGLQASGSPSVSGAVVDNRNAGICSVVIETQVLRRSQDRGAAGSDRLVALLRHASRYSQEQNDRKGVSVSWVPINHYHP
jgi:hypothetical protein